LILFLLVEKEKFLPELLFLRPEDNTFNSKSASVPVEQRSKLRAV